MHIKILLLYKLESIVAFFKTHLLKKKLFHIDNVLGYTILNETTKFTSFSETFVSVIILYCLSKSQLSLIFFKYYINEKIEYPSTLRFPCIIIYLTTPRKVIMLND